MKNIASRAFSALLSALLILNPLPSSAQPVPNGGGGGGAGGGVVTQPTPSLLNTTEVNSAAILAAAKSPISSYNIQTAPTVPTIQAAAYASGNAIGGLQTIAFFRTTALPTALIDQFAIEWQGGETVAITVYLFNNNPTGTTCTDKTAFSLAVADAKQLVTPPFVLAAAAPTGASQTFAAQSLAVSATNLDGTPTTNLYVCLVGGGTFTPAVGDLSLTISGVQD